MYVTNKYLHDTNTCVYVPNMRACVTNVVDDGQS